jgi:hypothetical protein
LEVYFEHDKNIGSSLPKFQKFILYTLEVLFIFVSWLPTRKKLGSSLKSRRKIKITTRSSLQARQFFLEVHFSRSGSSVHSKKSTPNKTKKLEVHFKHDRSLLYFRKFTMNKRQNNSEVQF